MNARNIRWLGHSSFLITSEMDDFTVYIDPVNIQSDAIADFIFITHTHYDHFSLKDILNISNKQTRLFITPDAQGKLEGFLGNTTYVEPNNRYQVDNIIVDTVPAYNENSSFHPESNRWVGYIIEIDRKRIYHAGDTDALEELKQLSNIDIGIFPVGGTYTMGPKEAAELANAIKPNIAIPMHYGSVVGTVDDAKRFKELFNAQTLILEKQ